MLLLPQYLSPRQPNTRNVLQEGLFSGIEAVATCFKWLLIGALPSTDQGLSLPHLLSVRDAIISPRHKKYKSPPMRPTTDWRYWKLAACHSFRFGTWSECIFNIWEGLLSKMAPGRNVHKMLSKGISFQVGTLENFLLTMGKNASR